MDGLFHGKSQSKMDDLGVPLFQETTMEGIGYRKVKARVKKSKSEYFTV